MQVHTCRKLNGLSQFCSLGMRLCSFVRGMTIWIGRILNLSNCSIKLLILGPPIFSFHVLLCKISIIPANSQSEDAATLPGSHRSISTHDDTLFRALSNCPLINAEVSLFARRVMLFKFSSSLPLTGPQ